MARNVLKHIGGLAPMCVEIIILLKRKMVVAYGFTAKNRVSETGISMDSFPEILGCEKHKKREQLTKLSKPG